MSKLRIGSGFDAHAFGEELANASVSHILIAGVEVPYHREVLAHSDGDVILHALCDAMLGALALGDIGKHFPDSAAEYKDANSRDLLRVTHKKITALHYHVVNVDLTLIAQAPRIAPYIDAMRGNIAEDLMIDISKVSVKASTTEKLGFIGRKEGLAAQASVLLELNDSNE